MKILFLTDNFPPERNAPASRTYEHCVEWVNKGAEVTVITCAPNFPMGEVFPGYKNKWYQEEIIDGIRVIRVWTYISANRGLFRRILDYMSFCITSLFASFFVKTDLIIATSPQLFTALSGYFASLLKRKPWVMEVRDLWPESIKAVGFMQRTNIILKVLDQLVLFLYRNADRVVVVTDTFKKNIAACGVDVNKIHVVKNGVHLQQYQQRAKNIDLLRKYKLENKFIVAYIGTHGMAQDLGFILDCATKVESSHIHFLFIGEGAFKSRLVKKAKQLELKNVTLLDAIPKASVAEHISIADVALVNLIKKKTFKKVLPSKIFENAAMAKPILLGVEGEAKKLIESYNAGLCYEPENQADFLANLEEMYMNKNKYLTFQHGCLTLANNFNRKRLATKMFLILESMGARIS